MQLGNRAVRLTAYKNTKPVKRPRGHHDQRHFVCVMDHATGKILEERFFPNTREQVRKLAATIRGRGALGDCLFVAADVSRL